MLLAGKGERKEEEKKRRNRHERNRAGRRRRGEVRMNGEIWKGRSKCELKRKGKRVK